MSLNKNAKISSNKSFGILFFVVFFIIAVWPLKSEGDLRLWSLILSLIFLFLGSINSRFLSPLNKLWFKLGGRGVHYPMNKGFADKKRWFGSF